jgi:hypothetical protein
MMLSNKALQPHVIILSVYGIIFDIIYLIVFFHLLVCRTTGP